VTLTFSLFNRKLTMHLLVLRGRLVKSILIVLRIFFVFELPDRTEQRHRQTDRRAGKTRYNLTVA